MKRFKCYCQVGICLAGVAIFSVADSMAYVMNIDLKDGGVAEYVLSQKPVMTYSGNDMVVTLPDGVFSYCRSDISRISFNESNGVEEVPGASCRFEFVNNVLTLPAGVSDFTLCDVAGKIVMSSSLSSEEKCVINLNTLPKGVYIVNIPNHKSFKVYKK